MTILFTQCRGCGEKFIVAVEQLVQARGQVRCNMCGTIFDALETLCADKPSEDEDLFLHQFGNIPPLLTQVYDIDVAPDEEILQVLSDILPENLQGDIKQSDGNEDEESQEPFFADTAANDVVANQRGQSAAVWLLLSLALVVLLGWQFIVALQRGTVKLPDGQFGERVCNWVDCAKGKGQVDLGAISLVARNIRPHPGRDEALLISASMTNASSSSQDFPILEIKLSDLNGDVIAMRRFKPEEYLSKDVVSNGFINHTLIPVRLEIESPGVDAVAFELGFAQP